MLFIALLSLDHIDIRTFVIRASLTNGKKQESGDAD